MPSPSSFQPSLAGDSSSPAGPSRRLGLFRTILLILGTLAIVAVAAFLTFLWLGASLAVDHADRAVAQAWRHILDSGWLLRLVAISSLLYRVVAAAQAAMATEMLAALALEGGGCLLPDLARLSLTRSQSAGPFQLAVSMPRLAGGRVNSAAAGLLAVLLAVTAASQFTSTMLLSDLGAARIVGDPATLDVAFGFNYKTDRESATNLFSPYSGVNYWTSRPPAYLRFTEASQPPVELDGIYDTGFSARGLLPLVNSTQRTTVRSYRGPATVVDARVVCVRPRLSSVRVGMTSRRTISLAGTVALARTYGGLRTRLAGASAFSCLVDAGRDGDRPRQRNIALCPVASSPADMRNGLRPDMASYTAAWLLVNSTATSEAWRASSASLGRLTATNESRSQGSWQSLSLADNAAVGIDATLCFANPIPWNYDIAAASAHDGVEPTLRWNLSTGAYSSDAVRSLLGAVPAPAAPEARGLLLMTAPANWSSPDAAASPKTINYIWSALRTSLRNVTLALSQEVNDDSDDEELLVPHRAHIGLFQDVLASTGGNAALALQALFFTMLQMAHADYAAEFDAAADATVLFSHEAVIPVQWRGFAGFCAVAGIHVALVMAVAAVFLLRTRASLLGNVWQAVGQVVELAGPEMVASSVQRTDEEVKEHLRAAGLAQTPVRLRLVAPQRRTSYRGSHP